MADLIKSVIYATDKLKNTQDVYHASALTLQETISQNQGQIGHLSTDLSEIKSLLSDNVDRAQEFYHFSAQTLQENISSHQAQIKQLSADLSEIKLLLREGFRLQPANRDSE